MKPGLIWKDGLSTVVRCTEVKSKISVNMNPEGTMCEEVANPLDNPKMNCIGTQCYTEIALVFLIKRSEEVKVYDIHWRSC